MFDETHELKMNGFDQDNSATAAMQANAQAFADVSRSLQQAVDRAHAQATEILRRAGEDAQSLVNAANEHAAAAQREAAAAEERARTAEARLAQLQSRIDQAQTRLSAIANQASELARVLAVEPEPVAMFTAHTPDAFASAPGPAVWTEGEAAHVHIEPTMQAVNPERAPGMEPEPASEPVRVHAEDAPPAFESEPVAIHSEPVPQQVKAPPAAPAFESVHFTARPEPAPARPLRPLWEPEPASPHAWQADPARHDRPGRDPLRMLASLRHAIDTV